MKKTSGYTADFFKKNQTSSHKSAVEIVPLVLDLVTCNSIIDVGCGDGIWLKVFQEHGVENILGVDGDYITPEILTIAKENFLSFDLTQKLKLDRQFDLVISLEVAEHLPPEFSDTFIDSLTSLGSCILFSAAIPYQPGNNHINSQWQDYWVDLFQKRGYVAIDCIRPKVWDNKQVSYWFAQNTFIFFKKDELESNPKLSKESSVHRTLLTSVVHPKLYNKIAKQTDPKTMSLKKSWKLLKEAIKISIQRKIDFLRSK